LLCSPAISRILEVPFPNSRLASVALQALRVDREISPLVSRELSTTAPSDTSNAVPPSAGETVLRVNYSAATNRMLRVAVNTFMDSLALVLEVMGELDVDVLETQKEKAA
jgi:EKC/KEOPS complex subunit PCC1/LAGE3